MRKFDYVVIVLVFATLIISVSFYLFHKPGIAYVRSQDLVYSYEGTKEAMSKFNNEKQKLLANADTLKAEFQRDIAAYNRQYDALDQAERKEYEERLTRKEQQVTSYTTAVNERIAAQDEEMMQAVLNQINSLVKEYAEQEGYEIILGTTLSGSVLYGSEENDITEELLEKLNKKYLGE